MMSDFPTHRSKTRTMLFADDIMIFSKVKRPIEAETTLQLAIDDAFRWGRKWKLSFAPDKSGLIVFTRSYKPGEEPLLFTNGHRINPKKSAKFLGLTFDQKLAWKQHINNVINSCLRTKNLCKILANTKAGPLTRTLLPAHYSKASFKAKSTMDSSHIETHPRPTWENWI